MTSRAARGLDSAPIHRLSSDILYMIFSALRDTKFSLDTPSVNKETWKWISVTHVCRHWRVTALSIPSLWSQLPNFRDLRKMEAFLERSKDADLAIYAKVKKISDEDSCEEEFACLMMALQKMDRVGSAQIALLSEAHLWKQVQELLKRPAPRLRNLALYGNSEKEKFDDIPELPEFAPLLRNLELCSLSAPANISHFANLKNLFLRSITDLSVPAILSALVFCQGLEELAISDVSFVDDTDSSLPSTNAMTVTLPQLKTLDVNFNDRSLPCQDKLLCCIHFPDSSGWKVSCVAETMQSFFDMDFLAAYLRKIPVCEEMTLFISSHVLIIWSRGPVAIPKSSLTGRHYALILAWKSPEETNAVCRRVESLLKASCWKDTGRVKVATNLNRLGFDEDDWASLLSALSSTESLEFTIAGGSGINGISKVESCVKVLTYQRTTPVPVHKVICPKLKEFSLRFRWRIPSPEDFIRLLGDGMRNRKRMGMELKEVTVFSPNHEESEIMAKSEYAGENIRWIPIEPEESIRI